MMKVKRTKQLWRADEDHDLAMLVSLHGENGCWPMIASQMNSRTGKQCRERYINHLSPRVKTDPWSSEEDDKIIKLHSMIGTKWCQFIPHLPGRSDNMIKNRWHLLQRSRSKRIQPPPAASSTASMSSMLELLGQRHHICSNQDQVACHLNSDDADDDASYITSTDTWSPFGSCSLDIMMDDDLIMRELQDIMDAPTPVPPSKRLCCRDVSDASSSYDEGRSITSSSSSSSDVTDEAESSEPSGNIRKKNHHQPLSKSVHPPSPPPRLCSSTSTNTSTSTFLLSSLDSISSDDDDAGGNYITKDLSFLLSDAVIRELRDVMSVDLCDMNDDLCDMEDDYGPPVYDCLLFED